MTGAQLAEEQRERALEALSGDRPRMGSVVAYAVIDARFYATATWRVQQAMHALRRCADEYGGTRFRRHSHSRRYPSRVRVTFRVRSVDGARVVRVVRTALREALS